MKRGRSFLAVALVATVLLSAAAPALAATMSSTSPDGINIGSDAVPDTRIDVTVQKDAHEVGWSPTTYENNNGDEAELEAHVNDTKNPVSYVATDVEFSDAGQFPRNDDEQNNTASALDASEWTKNAGGSAGSGSVSDVTTAPGVEAVSFSTSSQSSSDVMVFEYTNFSITSDEAKRNLQLAADVNTLDSGAMVEIRVVDTDGDYKSVYVEPDNATSADNTLANATGEGQVLQQQLGELTTTTAGGGDFADIQKLQVRIVDADADLDVSLINAESLGEYSFGEQWYDEDGDGDKDETQTLKEPSGRVNVKSLDTLGSSFDDAVVHNAKWDMVFAAADLTESMDVHWNTTEATQYPGFDVTADVYFRLQLPSQYDLSYSNAELVGTQELPSERYQQVEIAEGIGDTAFENVSSWADKTSTFSSTGDHVLDGTIQVDQQIAFHANMKWTEDDRSAAFSTGGGAGQFAQGGDGGIIGMIMSLPGIIIGGIASFLGIRKWRA
ncbi:hypothetical protein ACKVMT_07080 [Halobacteriales archaeon Cl-PHB]